MFPINNQNFQLNFDTVQVKFKYTAIEMQIGLVT